MSKHFVVSSIRWGILLWLFGYLLGFLFFAFVPTKLIGWVIMPFGLVATWWVITKKIKANTIRDYFLTGLIWASTAIVLDFFFLVKLLNPIDGYYKLDVYLYYFFTFSLPLIFGKIKLSKQN